MKKNHILILSHDYQMDKSQILGKGSTGQVYLGKQISTGLPVAIKLIRLETIDNQVTQYLLRMEKAALTNLNHQNILKGLKIIENSSKCYIITEYCNGGTLKQLIKKQGTLSQEKSLQILKGLLRGYNLLARKKIVHRDLKPANIMLHNMTPKIIDFGYCQIQGYEKPSLEYNVGSPSYMAPESFEQNIYNEKTEIWAIGIILYECLMGKTFDDGKHMSQVFKALKKFGIPFSKQVGEKSRKIISWCLEFSPDKRPTALELLNYLAQKNLNEPQFFILDKNRKKSNSLYANPIDLESNGLVTKRKIPAVERRIPTVYQTEQTFLDSDTLRKKHSIKEQPKVILEELEKNLSRNSSRSNDKFGAIIQQKVIRKIEKIQHPKFETRERISSNFLVKNEYGLNNNLVFKTQKHFTGQNVQNKIPVSHHISAFNSGMTSPREAERKSTKTIMFTNVADRNPESGKQRISTKTISTNGQVYGGQNYFQMNPSSVHYRYSAQPQQKPIERKTLSRNQNMPSFYTQQDQHSLTSRQSLQQYVNKPMKPMSQFTEINQNVPSQYLMNANRERPSSSIYQLNKFLEDKEKPQSIFRTGLEIGQKTCR